jgi:hypothetical protein
MLPNTWTPVESLSDQEIKHSALFFCGEPVGFGIDFLYLASPFLIILGLMFGGGDVFWVIPGIVVAGYARGSEMLREYLIRVTEKRMTANIELSDLSNRDPVSRRDRCLWMIPLVIYVVWLLIRPYMSFGPWGNN